MYRHCYTAEAARRQREIEICLMETMKRRPYAEISVSELCAQLHISRKSFYRYFENKEDALCGLLDHTIMEFISFTTSTQTSDYNLQQLESYLIYWQGKKDLLDALEVNGMSMRLIERVFLNAIGKDSGVIHRMNADADEDKIEQILFMINGIISTVIYWHHTGCKKTTQQMASTIFRFLTEPMIHLSDIS